MRRYLYDDDSLPIAAVKIGTAASLSQPFRKLSQADPVQESPPAIVGATVSLVIVPDEAYDVFPALSISLTQAFHGPSAVIPASFIFGIEETYPEVAEHVADPATTT